MSSSKVETISRMAQWRIDDFGSSNYKQSDLFKIGLWNWSLSVQKNQSSLYIWLSLEVSPTSKEPAPAAKCVLRLTAPSINRDSLVTTATDTARGTFTFFYPLSSYDHNKGVIRDKNEFVWIVNCKPQGSYVIDVEFHGLKIAQETGEGGSSIWAPSDRRLQLLSFKTTPLRCLSGMLLQSIHADVTIITGDNGSLKAHKAILCAASPVVQTMFHHDLMEKQSSTINIQDMSKDLCAALLGYLYGTIKADEFWKHRLELLIVAHKYDISDLRDHCEESLLADIDTGNVFGLLQEAWIYQFPKLQKGCFKYLFDFGKIYDMEEEMMNNFSDTDLMRHIFQQIFHPRAYLPTAISDEFDIVVT
nr:BTB/POZ domain-containing protein At1g21780 [Ipomoea batatas]